MFPGRKSYWASAIGGLALLGGSQRSHRRPEDPMEKVGDKGGDEAKLADNDESPGRGIAGKVACS